MWYEVSPVEEATGASGWNQKDSSAEDDADVDDVPEAADAAAEDDAEVDAEAEGAVFALRVEEFGTNAASAAEKFSTRNRCIEVRAASGMGGPLLPFRSPKAK